VRVLPRPERDAHALAVARLAAAAVDARALRDAAQRDADAIREQARAEGVALARAEAAAVLCRAEVAAHETLTSESEALGALALEIAGTVLGREAACGPDVLRDVVRRSLEKLRRARRIVLRVHPEEREIAAAQARAWLPAGSAPELLAVEADAAVERGFAVVETEIGRLDARLATQLDAIGRALRGR
jgi:flagellar biosynthesis/type III secretory pathway protein FliH